MASQPGLTVAPDRIYADQPTLVGAMPLQVTMFSALAIVLGALAFSLPALVNGFPFVFPDSGDYLVLHPLVYRPPFYGLFYKIVSLWHFIWLPIAAQNLIASALILTLARRVAPGFCYRAFYTIVVFLTVLSSLPFFTNFIMADIFTSFLFLSMYLVVFHYESLSRTLLFSLLVLCCLAVASHITNLTLAVGLLGLMLIIKSMSDTTLLSLRPIAILTAPVAAAAAAIVLFNGVIFGAWTLAPAGQPFLLANLIQNGSARAYLQEACTKPVYKICAYQDQLPQTAEQLLWSSGIVQKLGGFLAMQQESGVIVHETIVSRPGDVMKGAALNFIHALETHAPAAELHSGFQVESFPGLLNQLYGPRVLAAYESSLEMADKLPYDLLNLIDQIVFPLSMIALLVLAWRSRSAFRSPGFCLSLTVLGFVIGDTLLCAVASGVHDRYQARVTWLAPMAALLLLFHLRDRYNRSRPVADPA